MQDPVENGNNERLDPQSSRRGAAKRLLGTGRKQPGMLLEQPGAERVMAFGGFGTAPDPRLILEKVKKVKLGAFFH